LLHFVAFFHVALLFSTEVDTKKVGVDNEKALELTKAMFSVGVDNEKALELDNKIFFFIFQPDFNIEVSRKNATKHHVA
jgi:hypothetical protein